MPTIKSLIGNRVLVAPIKPPTTLSGIHLPPSLQDDFNTGGVKLYRVLMVGPGKLHPNGRHVPMECVPGDRVFCHSYTDGPQEFEDGTKIITYNQIIAVLPQTPHADHVQQES